VDDDAIGLYPPMPGAIEAVPVESADAEAGEIVVPDYGPILESICGGVDDSQPVEQYDGSLGVTKAFVGARQRMIGQLQWDPGLGNIYTNPGNVSGARWCTGVMIGHNLMLTAGHCFDRYPAGGWVVPRKNGTNTPIPPGEMARRMHVNFDYQVRPNGTLRREVEYEVDALIEYRRAGLDYAIVQLADTPGSEMGVGELADSDPPVGTMLAIIGHPAAAPKRIEAGPLTLYDGDRMYYNDIDTLGGNSGSAIWASPAGTIAGVHTNGGCNAVGTGVNSGYRIARIRTVSPSVKRLDLAFPLASGVRTVRQASTGRYLDAWQRGDKNFSAVTRPKESNDSQKWVFTRVGIVVTLQQVSSGRFVDAYTSGNDHAAVTRAMQRNDTQHWVAVAVPGVPGTYTLQQLANRRFLDAYTAGSNHAAVTRPAQGNATQRWRFTSVGAGSGEFTIRQAATGRYLDAHGSSAADHAVVTRPEQGDDTQRWRRTTIAGVFTIRQLSSNRYLDAHAGGSADYSVVTRPNQGDDTQRWLVEYLGGTRYRVQQLSTARFLDAHQAASEDWSAVTRQRQENATQRWQIL
jgi:V8-like Glu-specific endopeptidase